MLFRSDGFDHDYVGSRAIEQVATAAVLGQLPLKLPELKIDDCYIRDLVLYIAERVVEVYLARFILRVSSMFVDGINH